MTTPRGQDATRQETLASSSVGRNAYIQVNKSEPVHMLQNTSSPSSQTPLTHANPLLVPLRLAASIHLLDTLLCLVGLHFFPNFSVSYLQ
jgi:hypothetical protein